MRKTTLSELEIDTLESFESLRRKLVDNLKDVAGFRNLGKLDISINVRDIVQKKSFCIANKESFCSISKKILENNQPDERFDILGK